MTDTANAPERNDELQSDRPFIVGWNLGFAEAEYQQAHGKPSDGDLSPQYQYTAAEMAEAQAKIARLTNALEEIADRHIPDQPAALDISEAEYVRRQHTELRRTARATLAEVRRFAGAALQENSNG
jgi:hypothetical protein